MNHQHLPHLDLAQYYPFITFRTAESTDSFLQSLVLQNKPNGEKQLEGDHYLDRSTKGAFLKGDVLCYLNDFLKMRRNDLYELVAFSVMPNHVHLLARPQVKLSLMMQKIKGSSAKAINERLRMSGQFWAKDYYDKAIRDEKHFSLVYQYIKNNPLKLNEPKNSIPRFYGVYENCEAKASLPPGTRALAPQESREKDFQ